MAQNGNLQKNTALVDFLIVDFSDTSEHFKVTGKKLEFIVQLFGGFISFLFTLSLSILTIASDQFKTLMDQIRPSVFFTIVALIFALLATLTLWVFEFSLRTDMMLKIYTNRLNFLRSRIYRALGKNTHKFPGFAYVTKNTTNPTVKVGMYALYSRAIQVLFSIILLPLSIVSLFLVCDPTLEWAVKNPTTTFRMGLLLLYLMGFLFNLLSIRWNDLLAQTYDKIDKQWAEGNPL
jgi:hypothetical protein